MDNEKYINSDGNVETCIVNDNKLQTSANACGDGTLADNGINLDSDNSVASAEFFENDIESEENNEEVGCEGLSENFDPSEGVFIQFTGI